MNIGYIINLYSGMILMAKNYLIKVIKLKDLIMRLKVLNIL